jgi:PAS domain S-box-containing protein
LNETVQKNFERGDRPAKAVFGICAVVAFITAIVLVGWTFDITFLKSVLPAFISMKANTALGLLSLSLSLWLLFYPSNNLRFASKTLAAFAFAIGAATMLQYLANINLGIDEFLFLDPMGVKGNFPRGRPAPITASCLMLLGASLFLITHGNRKIRSMGQLFNFVTWIAACQSLVSYATGTSQSFGKQYYSQMALHTSISIILLSIGLLISTRREGMVAVLIKKNAGGSAARRMVASAVLIPSLVWWISAQGVLLGLYDDDMATLIRLLGNMILFLGVAWNDSLNLHELDEDRKSKTLALLTSNGLLNSIIDEQSTMLEELRRAQIEIVESKTAFEHIAETLPHMIWTMLPDRTITYLNRRAQLYFGVEDKADFRLMNYIHPDDVATSADRWTIQLAKGTFSDVEVRYRGIDGIYRWHMAHMTPTRDANGKIIQWTGAAVNIDFKKRTMEELESARMALEMAQDAAQLGTWTFDVKRRLVLGSSFHDKLYGQGRPLGEITPEELNMMMHKDDRGVFKAALEDAVRHNFANYEMEYRVVWADGSIHWLKAMARIVKDDEDKIIYHLGITFDVTDIHSAREDKAKQQIREEAANESSRLKSEFLATMSHEIRTPINGVMGMTNILLDTQLTIEQREYANAIKRSGNSLLVVINDILDFSKIEANKLDFEEIDFNFTQAIEDASTATRFLATKKGLTIEQSIDAQIPKVLNGDPGRLQQIISNLLSNAVKFTPSGTISVSALFESNDDQGTVVRFEVKDSGVGISAEGKEKLFQAFSQADSSTTRKYGGTGLGLSISRHLVERMSGKIGVESELGKGSTFWFTATFKAAEVKVLPLASVEEKPRIVKRCRILIAEDVQINQIVALRMVEKLGHFAHAVANGKEVIDALHNGDYDLILMDCHMPEMDGFEATREVRISKTIPNPDIWIVAMTASAMKGDKERCLAIGMNDYVSKPIEPKSLEKILNKWLIDEGKTALDVTA